MAIVALGADHAGFPLKEELKAWLTGRGLRVLDFGTHSAEPVDYPDYAVVVADAVTAGIAERGVLACGTGVGMAIAANKIAGIRAVVAPDVFTARISREHNDTNVLALGARVTPAPVAVEILHAWMGTRFAGGRHALRVDKLARLDGVRRERALHVAAR